MSIKKIKLTEGSLELIFRGDYVANPIVQILQSIKMRSTTYPRYRLVLSDGRKMVSFAFLPMKTSSEVPPEDNSVVKLNRYIVSTEVQYARFLLVDDFSIIMTGSEIGQRIGSPFRVLLGINDGIAFRPELWTPSPQLTAPPPLISDVNTPASPKERKPTLGNWPLKKSNGRLISPISSISIDNQKWIIKARVMNKTAIKKWTNGKGSHFNVELIDESGEIKLTVYTELIKKFYNKIIPDKSYYISQCKVKAANPQYNLLNHPFEISASFNTIIDLCNETIGAVPTVDYTFISIKEIFEMESGTIVDLIGICFDNGFVEHFASKSNGEPKRKRDLHVQDSSIVDYINVTLWDEAVDQFKEEPSNQVVVVKRGRIHGYGDSRSVELTMSSHIRFNPNIPEVKVMKDWWNNNENKKKHVNYCDSKE